MYGISNGQQQSGGGSSGGGSINYTKIESTIPTSAWVSTAPSWIGQNALTWSANGGGVYYTQGGTEDLGLSADGSYSAVLTIDGTDYDAENPQVMDANGMVTYAASFNNNAAMLQIIDHCVGLGDSGPIAGNGYLVMVIPMSETVPSSIIVKSFSAAGGGISAIISNSAIKVNSAVTMYIDYNGKIKAKEKTDGSVIVTASETPITAISYAIEITDTNTEGLFEIINNNFPIIPDIPDTPSGVPQWHIIYEDTTGTGAVSVELSEPLQAGGLYRITFGGSVYMFCSPSTGRVSYQGGFTISTDVFQDANTMGHLAYKFTHNNTSLSLKYLAQYTITDSGVSNISFADNTTIQSLKITKVEVYR